jgi:hypothetical protein
MRTRYLLLVVGLCLFYGSSSAQSTTGALTISFTVAPSSTILMLPDGKMHVYVANPPADNDARAIYFPPLSPEKKHDDAIQEERTKLAALPKKQR